MRRPIQLQILVPMLLVVMLSVGLSSIASAWLGGAWAIQAEQTHLQRVVATLADAGFPLTENVLRRMTGLSGAEFLVVDRTGQIRAATLSLSPEQLARVPQVQATGGALRSQEIVNVANRPYLVARVSLRGHAASADSDSLVVLYPEELGRTAAWQAAMPPLFAGAFAALVAVVLTAWLTRRFVRPIQQLRGNTAAIAEGIFRQVPLPTRDDELQDLALAINRMVEQLSQYDVQIRRSERLRTLGQLGAGMAHQLRNSITGARLALEFHERELPPAADREALEVAARQLTLTEAYLQRFLRLGLEPAAHVPLRLDDLVEETLPLIRPACRHAGIELHWHRPSDSCTIQGDVESLRQLLLNLLLNAVQAATPIDGQQGTVRIELIRGDRTVTLRVLDTGPGPADAISGRLFEPFVTDKPDGTGLGLSVARQVAEEHAASLHWERCDGMTCFAVEFSIS